MNHYEITHIVKFLLQDPEPNNTPEEIFWHNIKIADEICDLNYFICATNIWLNENSNKNLQDFEKELRNRNFKTHLIAKKIELTDPNLQLKLGDQQMKYGCLFSCKSSELAMTDLLQEWPSYQENFKNLANTGFVSNQTNDININNNETEKSNTNNQEKNINELLFENKKKINIDKIPIEDHLNSIINHYRKDLGKIPISRAITIIDGNPVIGYFVDGQLISNYCFILDLMNNKKIYFDVQNLEK